MFAIHFTNSVQIGEKTNLIKPKENNNKQCYVQKCLTIYRINQLDSIETNKNNLQGKKGNWESTSQVGYHFIVMLSSFKLQQCGCECLLVDQSSSSKKSVYVCVTPSAQYTRSLRKGKYITTNQVSVCPLYAQFDKPNIKVKQTINNLQGRYRNGKRYVSQNIK